MVKTGVLVQAFFTLLVFAVVSFLVVYRDKPSSPLFISDAAKEGMIWHSMLEADTSESGELTRQPFVKLSKQTSLTLSPSPIDLSLATMKLDSTIAAVKNEGDRSPLNFVVYNIEDIEEQDSAPEQIIDNIRLFMEAIKRVDSTSSFFWVNVGSGVPDDVLSLIPVSLPYVARVQWTLATSPMYSFMETIRLLGAERLRNVGAIVSLNSGVRGPLLKLDGGAWLFEYRALLDQGGVGLVGPVISCDETPHVQTHMFLMRPALVTPLLVELERYYLRTKYIPMSEYFRTRLSLVARSAGYKIGSMLRSKKRPKAYLDWDSECTELYRVRDGETCALDPTHVLFVRWGGGDWGELGYPCSKGVALDPVTRARVRGLTRSALWTNTVLPQHNAFATSHEVVAGGMLYDLYREHSAELTQYDSAVAQRTETSKQPQPTGTAAAEDSKVCFLVRTAAMHDPMYRHPGSTGKGRVQDGSDAADDISLDFVEMDLDVLIKCASPCLKIHLYHAAYFWQACVPLCVPHCSAVDANKRELDGVLCHHRPKPVRAAPARDPDQLP